MPFSVQNWTTYDYLLCEPTQRSFSGPAHPPMSFALTLNSKEKKKKINLSKETEQNKTPIIFQE